MLDGLATSSTNLEPNLWVLRVPNTECSTLILTDIWSGFYRICICPYASNNLSASPNGLTATTAVALASPSASPFNILDLALASLISASTWSNSSDGVAIWECQGVWSLKGRKCNDHSNYEKIRSKKWKWILWQSIQLIWNYVDLRRKYTRRTQGGQKRPIIRPWPH